MSAEEQGEGPPSEKAPAGQAAAEPTPAAPSATGQPAEAGPKVISSHGENATSAYVASIPVPKRQRLKTVDMSKVRIASDAKVEIADPRHMPTTKMEIPPGGLRPPPPPPQGEVTDPSASPWSTTGGIDRSLLPSSSLGPTSAPTTTRPPPLAAKEDESRGGIGIWIAVVVIAAVIGGGAAFLLRGRGASNTSATAQSAPISVGVPNKAPSVPGPSTTSETPSEEPAEEPVENADAGADGGTGAIVGGPKTYVPRKTAPKTPGTGTTTAPTSTGTGTKRIFN